jgi:phage FluMu protein Com
MLNKFSVYLIGHHYSNYPRLNINDTKTISCVMCNQVIREIDFDAEIIRPKCGQSSNPTSHPKDKMPYLISH